MLDFEKCCQLSRYDRNRVVELFRDLNFNTLLAKLPVSEVEPLTQMPAKVENEKPKIVYRTINTLEELELLIRTFRDTEFSGYFNYRFKYESYVSQNHRNIYITTGRYSILYSCDCFGYCIKRSKFGFNPMLNTLKPILENQTGKIIHNSKYDLILLAEKNIKLNNLTFDTMLAGYLLGDKSLSLKDIVF